MISDTFPEQGGPSGPTTHLTPETAIRLARGLNAFGFRLLRCLPKEENLLLSPLSIWVTLMALVPGARGETRSELVDALTGEGRKEPGEIPGDDLSVGTDPGGLGQALAVQAGRLANALRRKTGSTWEEDPETGEWTEKPSDLFALEMATALWAAESYPFHQAYVDTLVSELSAKVESLDFQNASAAADRMNAWARKATRDRISSIVTADTIDPLTRMALANATFFKAAWATPFQPEATSSAPFHAPDGEVRVEMMRGTADRGHIRLDEPGFDAVNLSYEAMSGLVIVPDWGQMDRVEASLNAELVNRVSSSLSLKEVTLHLPRFEFGAGLALEAFLPRLGVRQALSTAADFSGISPHPEGLGLTHVLHEARIKVDEEGTEAAAVTMAMMGALAMPEEEPQRVTVVLDRPFFFLIRDPETGAILFLARVLDPTA